MSVNVTDAKMSLSSSLTAFTVIFRPIRYCCCINGMKEMFTYLTLQLLTGNA